MAKVKFTAGEIVADILQKAERDNTCKLNIVDIGRDPLCPSVYYIRKVYPDPADAIRAAGLYPANPSDADLIRSLWKFYWEEKRIPRAMDALDGMLVYTIDTYKAHFGNSWRKVLTAAGLLEDESDACWKEAIATALVQEVIALYVEQQYLPTCEEHDRTNPLHDSQYIVRYVGGWDRLAERTGLQLKSTSLRTLRRNATVRARQAAS